MAELLFMFVVVSSRVYNLSSTSSSFCNLLFGCSSLIAHECSLVMHVDKVVILLGYSLTGMQEINAVGYSATATHPSYAFNDLNFSIPSMRAFSTPSSFALWPLSEITRYSRFLFSAPPSALYSAQLVAMGHTTSYRPCTMTMGRCAMRWASVSSCPSGMNPPLTK
jgi:hypothetical protein